MDPLRERVASRYLVARKLTDLDFFYDEGMYFPDIRKEISATRSELEKVKAILKSLAECLESKALAKVYGEAQSWSDKAQGIDRELDGMATKLIKIDADCLVEAQRLSKDLAEGKKLSARDVRIPSSVKDYSKEVRSFNRRIESAFENLSLDIDDYLPSELKSPKARAYERLLEKVPSWEEFMLQDPLESSDVYLAGQILEKAEELADVD